VLLPVPSFVALELKKASPSNEDIFRLREGTNNETIRPGRGGAG